MKPPIPSFAHLRRLTDDRGLFEHAQGSAARRDCGYCLDDVARALVVVSREPPDNGELAGLTAVYLAFVLAAQAADGRFCNRLSLDRQWTDQPSIEDHWGRAMWALGVAAGSDATTGAALDAFTRGARWRSPWPRSMAFAALGAAEVLRLVPDHQNARSLLVAAAQQIGRPRAAPSWPWPEDPLTNAKAVNPEALLAAGVALDNKSLTADGLLLLEWLLQRETRAGQLSVTPVGGRGPDEVGPAFDQQPIEVAAIADACARAYAITNDRRWADRVELAVEWFLGANDSATPLYDPMTGAGCDGLEPFGRNENRGAESTLAALSTLQQGLRLPALSR